MSGVRESAVFLDNLTLQSAFRLLTHSCRYERSTPSAFELRSYPDFDKTPSSKTDGKKPLPVFPGATRIVSDFMCLNQLIESLVLFDRVYYDSVLCDSWRRDWLERPESRSLLDAVSFNSDLLSRATLTERDYWRVMEYASVKTLDLVMDGRYRAFLSTPYRLGSLSDLALISSGYYQSGLCDPGTFSDMDSNSLSEVLPGRKIRGDEISAFPYLEGCLRSLQALLRCEENSEWFAYNPLTDLIDNDWGQFRRKVRKSIQEGTFQADFSRQIFSLARGLYDALVPIDHCFREWRAGTTLEKEWGNRSRSKSLEELRSLVEDALERLEITRSALDFWMNLRAIDGYSSGAYEEYMFAKAFGDGEGSDRYRANLIARNVLACVFYCYRSAELDASYSPHPLRGGLLTPTFLSTGFGYPRTVLDSAKYEMQEMTYRVTEEIGEHSISLQVPPLLALAMEKATGPRNLIKAALEIREWPEAIQFRADCRRLRNQLRDGLTVGQLHRELHRERGNWLAGPELGQEKAGNGVEVGFVPGPHQGRTAHRIPVTLWARQAQLVFVSKLQAQFGGLQVNRDLISRSLGSWICDPFRQYLDAIELRRSEYRAARAAERVPSPPG